MSANVVDNPPGYPAKVRGIQDICLNQMRANYVDVSHRKGKKKK
jgi:hypothetical protein